MNNPHLKRNSSALLAILIVLWMPPLQAGDKDASATQRIQELEKTIAVLRADNAALRGQLANLSKQPVPVTNVVNSTKGPSPAASDAAQADASAHWISGTGKRHNANCRYFGTGKGHACGPNEGAACKICGG
jgi:cell division protein FtsB